MPALLASAETHQPLSIVAQARKKILLVDDDGLILRSMTQVLSSHGHEVISCRDGAAAITAFTADENVDLLLTDFQMPGMTGLELATSLTRTAPELRVLIVSGTSSEELPLWELWRKKWCFLPKPTSAALLLKTVDHLCGAAPTLMQEEFLGSARPCS